MPRGYASRVTGRDFAVREYAQWLNAMSDREYDTIRNGYNTRGARRNIETFEDSLRSFDRELQEYLRMNRAAGFRSVPGPSLINDLLSMWLDRDAGGEPARRVFLSVQGSGQLEVKDLAIVVEATTPILVVDRASEALLAFIVEAVIPVHLVQRASEAILTIIAEATTPGHVVDGAGKALLTIIAEATTPGHVVDGAGEALLTMCLTTMNSPQPVVVIHFLVSHVTLPLLLPEVPLALRMGLIDLNNNLLEVIMVLDAEEGPSQYLSPAIEATRMDQVVALHSLHVVSGIHPLGYTPPRNPKNQPTGIFDRL